MRGMRLRYALIAAAGVALAFVAVSYAGEPAVKRATKANIVFYSNQLVPIEEAEKMRTIILKGFSQGVDFVTAADDRALEDRIVAEVRTGNGKVDVIGALHGNYVSFQRQNVLKDLSDVRRQLSDAGIPLNLLNLGRVGTKSQLYIPWMQATYIMVANKKVLPLLPAGADRDHLTYPQLLQWARNIKKKYGVGRLGFPAGDSGLFHRFLQGFFLPSFTGRNVTRFKSADAVAGWQYLKQLWPNVHPQSLTYGFMQDPLLSGEVLLAWDHVARVKTALEQKPLDFVTFPAPAGPKGRAYMPVIAGLGMPRTAPNVAGGKALIRYMLSISTQARTLSAVGFFPVRKGRLSKSLSPGLLKEASAVNKTLNARDALPALLPIGLGAEGGNYNRVFRDTFTRIVIQGQDIRTVLNDQGGALQALFDKTGAPCWSPDPSSAGRPCRVG